MLDLKKRQIISHCFIHLYSFNTIKNKQKKVKNLMIISMFLKNCSYLNEYRETFFLHSKTNHSFITSKKGNIFYVRRSV